MKIKWGSFELEISMEALVLLAFTALIIVAILKGG